MKLTSIYIEKSKTIHINGRIGSDAYRKIVFSATAEIQEGEEYDKIRVELNSYVDTVLEEQTQQIRDEHKEQINSKH